MDELLLYNELLFVKLLEKNGSFSLLRTNI